MKKTKTTGATRMNTGPAPARARTSRRTRTPGAGLLAASLLVLVVALGGVIAAIDSEVTSGADEQVAPTPTTMTIAERTHATTLVADLAEREPPAVEALPIELLSGRGPNLTAELGRALVDARQQSADLAPEAQSEIQKIGKRVKKTQNAHEKASQKLADAQAALEAAQDALLAAQQMPESSTEELTAKTKALNKATKAVAHAQGLEAKRLSKLGKLGDKMQGFRDLIADIDSDFYLAAASDVPSLAVVNLEEQDLLFYWTTPVGATSSTLTWDQSPGVTPGEGTFETVDTDLYVLTGLPDELSVWAVVTSTVDDLESEASNEVEALTGPLTPQQIEKLARLQKLLDKKLAKQQVLEQDLADAEADLALAQDELAAAEALPESTPEQQAAKLAAIKAAQKHVAKAESSVARITARLETLEVNIAKVIASIEDEDPDYFESVTAIPSPEIVDAVGGSGFVFFDWTDVDGADSYRLYMSTQEGVTPETGAPFVLAQSAFALENLPSDFTVHAIVTAIIDDAETPPSNEASASTDPPTEPDPVLAIDSLSISFLAVQGGASPSSHDVQVANEGGGVMDWTAVANANWISATPSSGSLSGGASATVSIGVNTSGLSAGTYHKTVTFASLDSANPSESLAVMVVVSEPAPVIDVDLGSLAFNATQGADPADQTLVVSNTGGGSLAWSATDNASWLSLSPASGSLSAGQSTSVSVAANTANAGVGVHNATITFAAPSLDSVPVPVSFTVTQASASTIATSIEPSRLTGVAPLSVLFDASGTTANGVTRPFHELEYQWNFGDVGSGSWETDDMSRNTARGPVAGHVFEEPGTYTVQLAVQSADGEVGTDTVEITVSDPDTVFAGNATVCISRTGDFTGAPSGSLHVTTTSFDTAMSHVATGKRVLFQRGESWTGGGKSVNTPGPVTIGAFGNGSKPSFDMSNYFMQLSGSDPNTDDWRIMDLDITGSSAYAFTFQGAVDGLLLLRLDMHDLYQSMVGDHSVLDYYYNKGHAQFIHREFAIVDTTVVHNAHMLFLDAERSFLLGNVLDTVTDGHVMRSGLFDTGVIAHNEFAHSTLTAHLLKLHAPIFNGSGLGNHRYTQKVIIADNVFDLGVTQWGVVPGPENSLEDQRLRNIIIERNLFRAGSSTMILLRMSGEDTTLRHNIFDLSGTDALAAIWVAKRGSEPAPVRCYVVNNSFYSGTSAGFVAIHVASDPVESVVRNNLASAPNANSSKTLLDNDAGSNTTNDHNLITNSPGWSPSPHDPGDFQIMAGSPAIDGGVSVAASLGDFTAANSAQDGNGDGSSEPDMGAFEYKP